MLDIVFLILKILGIILLVILGILIVIIGAMVLFPAKYRIVADADGDFAHSSIALKMHWLFHLVEADVGYKDGEFDWKARIFWITEQENAEQESTVQEDKKQSAKKEPPTKAETELSDTVEIKEHIEEQKPIQKRKKKTAVRQWIDKIQYTFKRICDKIKKLIQIKDEVLAFLNDETHRNTFQKLKRELFIIFKHYRPRKMKGKIRFGFEDPYHTGQALAALSLIYPFYGKDVQVFPEFEQKILEGHIVIKGHIRASHMLRLAFLWIFDKDVKKTYHYFTNLKL